MEHSRLGNWPKDVPNHIDYPEIPISELLRHSSLTSPEEVAVVYVDRKLTFRELDRLVDRFAAAMQDLGVAKGDRVVIDLPNIPQFVTAYYGVLRAGGIVVACSPLYKERELGHIVKDSGAKTIVALDTLYPVVQAIRSETQLIEVVTTTLRCQLPPQGSSPVSPSRGVGSHPRNDFRNMEALLELTDETPKSVRLEPKRDLALLQYTGGTTGVPKGAMLTHYNLCVNAKQFTAWVAGQPGESYLAALPLFHIFGMTVAMNSPILEGSSMILVPDPRDIPGIIDAIEEHRPAIFPGVPTMYNALVNAPAIGQRDLRSLRVCISGGSALPTEVQRKFELLTGGRLVEGYGLTETSPVTHLNPVYNPGKTRTGSIGIPVSDTEAKIVDLETGLHDVPRGEAGELVIRGPQVMVGYWNNPEETRMAFQGGWLHTGDIATMDRDGYFMLIDRKKDMIDVSGFKVWPREVEEVLYEHPAIREAAVVGVPDEKSGEAVKAYVVLKSGLEGKVQAQEISKFCKDRIASFKAPKIVEFRNELPKTPVGKVLRRDLKEQNKDESRVAETAAIME